MVSAWVYRHSEWIASAILTSCLDLQMTLRWATHLENLFYALIRLIDTLVLLLEHYHFVKSNWHAECHGPPKRLRPEVTEDTLGILRLTFSCFVKKCMWKKTKKCMFSRVWMKLAFIVTCERSYGRESDIHTQANIA